jgi:hypothetical protein
MPNLRKWSTTATGNASIAGGATTINWAEGQLPSTVNNSMREESAQIRQVYKPSEWGWVEFSATASVASQTTFKITGDQTTDYIQGRRVRLYGGSTVAYGDIVSSSFTAETTVTLKKDSGSLSASMSIAAVSAVYNKNYSNLIEIIKTASQTVSNSTALVNDLELFTRIEANTDYLLELDVWYSSNAAADFQSTITGPAAPTLVNILIEQVAPDIVSADNPVTAFSFTHTILHGSNTVGHVRYSGIIHNGANAGTVQYQWAPNSVSATNTIVRKGSFLRLRRFN